MKAKERFVVLHDMKEYEFDSFEDAISFIKRENVNEDKNSALLIILREGKFEYDDVVKIIATEQIFPGCLAMNQLYV